MFNASCKTENSDHHEQSLLTKCRYKMYKRKILLSYSHMQVLSVRNRSILCYVVEPQDLEEVLDFSHLASSFQKPSWILRRKRATHCARPRLQISVEGRGPAWSRNWSRTLNFSKTRVKKQKYLKLNKTKLENISQPSRHPCFNYFGLVIVVY